MKSPNPPLGSCLSLYSKGICNDSTCCFNHQVPAHRIIEYLGKKIVHDVKEGFTSETWILLKKLSERYLDVPTFDYNSLKPLAKEIVRYGLSSDPNIPMQYSVLLDCLRICEMCTDSQMENLVSVRGISATAPVYKLLLRCYDYLPNALSSEACLQFVRLCEFAPTRLNLQTESPREMIVTIGMDEDTTSHGSVLMALDYHWMMHYISFNNANTVHKIFLHICSAMKVDSDFFALLCREYVNYHHKLGLVDESFFILKEMKRLQCSSASLIELLLNVKTSRKKAKLSNILEASDFIVEQGVSMPESCLFPLLHTLLSVPKPHSLHGQAILTAARITRSIFTILKSNTPNDIFEKLLEILSSDLIYLPELQHFLLSIPTGYLKAYSNCLNKALDNVSNLPPPAYLTVKTIRNYLTAANISPIKSYAMENIERCSNDNPMKTRRLVSNVLPMSCGESTLQKSHSSGMSISEFLSQSYDDSNRLFALPTDTNNNALVSEKMAVHSELSSDEVKTQERKCRYGQSKEVISIQSNSELNSLPHYTEDSSPMVIEQVIKPPKASISKGPKIMYHPSLDVCDYIEETEETLPDDYVNFNGEEVEIEEFVFDDYPEVHKEDCEIIGVSRHPHKKRVIKVRPFQCNNVEIPNHFPDTDEDDDFYATKSLHKEVKVTRKVIISNVEPDEKKKSVFDRLGPPTVGENLKTTPALNSNNTLVTVSENNSTTMFGVSDISRKEKPIVLNFKNVSNSDVCLKSQPILSSASSLSQYRDVGFQSIFGNHRSFNPFSQKNKGFESKRNSCQSFCGATSNFFQSNIVNSTNGEVLQKKLNEDIDPSATNEASGTLEYFIDDKPSRKRVLVQNPFPIDPSYTKDNLKKKPFLAKSLIDEQYILAYLQTHNHSPVSSLMMSLSQDWFKGKEQLENRKLLNFICKALTNDSIIGNVGLHMEKLLDHFTNEEFREDVSLIASVCTLTNSVIWHCHHINNHEEVEIIVTYLCKRRLPFFSYSVLKDDDVQQQSLCLLAIAALDKEKKHDFIVYILTGMLWSEGTDDIVIKLHIGRSVITDLILDPHSCKLNYNCTTNERESFHVLHCCQLTCQVISFLLDCYNHDKLVLRESYSSNVNLAVVINHLKEQVFSLPKSHFVEDLKNLEDKFSHLLQEAIRLKIINE